MATLTIEYAASLLDRSEYRFEGSDGLWADMKSEGLVAVFGASDDLMEFRGAITDEFYSEVHILNGKVLHNKCECEDCPNYNTESAASIEPIFCEDSTFDYETQINCARFVVMEEGEVYGYGMVFDILDTVV